jgi:RNA polymerase sigma-70 factor (ECF subfamily)
MTTSPYGSKLLEELMALRPEFLAFARKQMPTAADAEDALQQAFLQATRKIANLRDPLRARAWFYRILRRKLLDTQKMHHKGLTVPLPPLVTRPAGEEAKTCACGMTVLADLGEQHQALIRHVDIEGEPVSKVASILGITPNAATVRLHRLRRSLKKKLQEYCHVETLEACLDCGCKRPDVSRSSSG